MKSVKGIIKTMKTLRLLRIILFIGIILFVLIFIGLHILVNIKGKGLLVKKLENTFDRKVSIGSLNTSFPTYVHIKNIEAEGLFKIKEVVAGGGLFDIFRRSFKLSLLKVINPIVTIEKGLTQPSAKGSSIQNLTSTFIPFIPADSEKKTEDKKVATPNLNPMHIVKGRFLFPRFYINHLIISDGTFNFIDRSVGNGGIAIKIEHLNTKVDNLNLSGRGSQITSFELKGKIPWKEGSEEGKIEAGGWLNLFKKDMQATLKIEDIDGIYLYPYYSNWVDLEKARIEKARLNFTSNIQGLNNNVTADCHLELTDIVRKPRPAEESEEKAEKIANAVLGILRALNQGKIVLNFTIRTKMDKPEFGFSNIKMAFEEKLAQGRKTSGFKVEDVLKLPANLLQGTVKSATDLTKAVIDGAASVGKELKKAVEETFKKEPKENKE